MKEMIYGSHRIKEILHEGDYEGYHYVILSIGTHPTAYVENKDNLSKDELDNISVHGGITWDEGAHWNSKDKRPYIGWDYAHLGDWDGFMTDFENEQFNNKKYTIKEIQRDVYSVINQLIKLKEEK